MQETEPDSTLSMYRSALRLRRGHNLGTGSVHWHEQGGPDADVDHPAIGPVRVLANPVRLDGDGFVPAGRVETDMCVWWVEGDHGS